MAISTGITPYNVKFRMWGRDYKVPSSKYYGEKDFNSWLFYARRLIGYVVAPRFSLIRLYLAEVQEMLKKRGIYKHKIKQAAKALEQELDRLEQRHKRRIHEEFMEVMTNALAGKVLSKTNELRGAMGGAMMMKGVKEYVFYSYPYTLMELLYDAKDVYNGCMEKIRSMCGIDFTTAFIDFRGDNAYMLSYKLMCVIVDTIKEDIPRIDLEASGAVDKINAIGRILLDINNMQSAFEEAAGEVEGELPVDVKMMDVWEEEKEDNIELLKTKFKVSKL